jgi:Spy/CpxP family protein refolding chaperone
MLLDVLVNGEYDMNRFLTKRLLGTALLVCSPAMAFSQHQPAGSSDQSTTSSVQSPYAGQQDRAITSLSESDQRAIEAGQGWGLAKPAELNGVPGPSHLLELGQQIGLSTAQERKLRQLFAEMKAQAIVLGHQYIKAERDLDAYFRSGRFSDAVLRQKVDAAAEALANLRYLHLSFHHRTLDVVTPEQVKQYNVLRGYSPAVIQDPCNNVPEGHDPAMFRKHMGCKP